MAEQPIAPKYQPTLDQFGRFHDDFLRNAYNIVRQHGVNIKLIEGKPPVDAPPPARIPDDEAAQKAGLLCLYNSILLSHLVDKAGPGNNDAVFTRETIKATLDNYFISIGEFRERTKPDKKFAVRDAQEQQARQMADMLMGALDLYVVNVLDKERNARGRRRGSEGSGNN